MTRTDARLDLCERQRAFEWQLARDEQTRAAATLVAGKTHDLLNLIQIVQLASGELEERCDASLHVFIDDLRKAAREADRSLAALMAVARPPRTIVRGAPVGAAVDAALAALRRAVQVDVHLATSPDTATRCTEAELEHLLIGLALDHRADHEPIELFVRERTIDGAPWIEIVRSTASTTAESFDLRVVEAIAKRAGGELARSERRGGGEELVVALPVV